jgi:hypothetical protein
VTINKHLEKAVEPIVKCCFLPCHYQIEDALIQQFADQLRRFSGVVPKHLHDDVEARSKVLAKNFSTLPVSTERPSRLARANILYTGIPSTHTYCDDCDDCNTRYTCRPSSSEPCPGHTCACPCASRSTSSSRSCFNSHLR